MLKDVNINISTLKKINQFKKKHSLKTKIIAVTKTRSIQAIDSALKNNIKIIGESRVVEAEKKFYNYKNRNKIELHLIGHLQSNKTKKAVSLFDVIETVDTEKIIKKINIEAKKQNKKQKIFLQINIGKDPKKHGFNKNNINKICEKNKKYKNIQIIGLMTILPDKLKTIEQKKHYTEMKKVQKTIQKKYLKRCVNLSMGMSQDYKTASQCGATHVRIGTLLYEE